MESVYEKKKWKLERCEGRRMSFQNGRLPAHLTWRSNHHLVRFLCGTFTQICPHLSEEQSSRRPLVTAHGSEEREEKH